jgi:hypothetical protein
MTHRFEGHRAHFSIASDGNPAAVGVSLNPSIPRWARRHCLELATQETHLRQEPPLRSYSMQVADGESERLNAVSGNPGSESHSLRNGPKRV